MKKYTFTAKFEPGPGGGAFVLFPYDAEEEFGAKGSVPVQATFDGIPYAGSLMRCGPQQHMLGILKSIQEQTGKQIGDTIKVEIWKDEQERTVEIPPPFAALLKKESSCPSLKNLVTPTARNTYAGSPKPKKKKPATPALTNPLTCSAKESRLPANSLLQLFAKRPSLIAFC